MAKSAIGSVYVELGGTTVSSRVESARLILGQSAVDVTAIGDGWEDYVNSKVKRWGVVLSMYQDYTSSDVDVYGTINDLITGSSARAFLVRPTSGDAGMANPQASGDVVPDGDIDFLVAERGAANKFSITLKGTGALTFTETSAT
jgi:hypothetical protein